MPSRALRPCAEPSCPELVKAGRCAAHEKERQKRADTKSPEARAFYNSTRWRKYRARYKREHPLCVLCLAEKRVTPMKVVDHIVPMEQGGAAWDEGNMQSLCDSHHNAKRARERNGTKGSA